MVTYASSDLRPRNIVPFRYPVGLCANAIAACAVDVGERAADVELRGVRAGAVVVVDGHGGYLVVGAVALEPIAPLELALAQGRARGHQQPERKYDGAEIHVSAPIAYEAERRGTDSREGGSQKGFSLQPFSHQSVSSLRSRHADWGDRHGTQWERAAGRTASGRECAGAQARSSYSISSFRQGMGG